MPIQRPQWLQHERWPFATAALATPVGRIAITDIGSGPTLLFVHVGSWSFIWRDLLLELSPHYHCVTIDAPGSGLSAHPGSPVSLRSAATAVGSVIEALDLRAVTMILHDVGGPVGLAAAAEHSERIAGLVALNAIGDVAITDGHIAARRREPAGMTGGRPRTTPVDGPIEAWKRRAVPLDRRRLIHYVKQRRSGAEVLVEDQVPWRRAHSSVGRAADS